MVYTAMEGGPDPTIVICSYWCSAQVCGLNLGDDGYLRKTVPSDLPAACQADPACLAAGLASLRVSQHMVTDGTHPSHAGAVTEPLSRAVPFT